ncbi:MAG: bifunctional 3-deoxy-7-phosphoheptulonate synthase/chorismate mutase type II [Paludibacteraceae bacterium]|nr:bifunctional 3-deoxy-7-phosphoheptulonate synthase/chorismate mutase type II [Paludibacteraceae bacterium]MEE3483642.1 bifunctional 3-deoxy-7-phosphoheptulonate synthase/chorismate mutase type II [Bacteroidales bacterium]
MELKKLGLTGVEEKRPLVIAGPCSAETEEQVIATAKQLADNGVKVFRAGIWKPRTKPGGFEGNGVKALPWLQTVKKETGMLTATEVATAKHVEEALKYGVDLLWIGARTTADPFAVQEIADTLQGTDVPVLIKNPVNPDLELWIGALQRLNNAGIRRLGAIHRGFSTYDKKLYRNLPQWHIPIELRRRIPELPIICDPSHISGRRDLIAPLCQQAMDLQFDGLIIESHIDPDNAWSDASQQVTPEVLNIILNNLVIRETNQTTENLTELRKQIDEIDINLIETLAKRMRISREIGTYKKEHEMPILQTTRYDEIINKRAQQGIELSMDGEFMKVVFEAIHSESVRQQMLIME